MINDRLNGIALMHKSLLNGISGKTTNISYIFKKMQLCLNFHFFHGKYLRLYCSNNFNVL